MTRLSLFALALAAIPAATLAQTPPTVPPVRACTLTPAQMAQNRQAVIDFFRPGISPADQTALLSPGYIQHNPRFKQFGQERGLNDVAAFTAMRTQAAQNPPPPAPPGRPANVPYERIMVDCDMVTVIQKNWQQVPGAAPGTWYETFAFDTFRVENGKMAEHWDAVVLAPPPAAPPPPPPGR